MGAAVNDNQERNVRSRPHGLNNVWPLLKETFSQWNNDRAPRLGAALAYYTVFSLVPLLVIIIALVGLVFGHEAAQSYILQQLAALLGEQSTEAIQEMVRRASEPASGLIAGLVAFITLAVGASGLFAELQDSLNTIWGVQRKESLGIWGLLKDRFVSLLAVMGTGFLLLVSLVVSAGLAAFGKWFGGWLPVSEFILQVLNILVSIVVITSLFAMMFKLLPDATVAWKDVWIGAFLTAGLFTLGKFAIGLYLGKSDIGSSYGAAASMVILLIWVYYSAQIFLLGAEFTQVYANTYGSQVVPAEGARLADSKKVKRHRLHATDGVA
jgi:membrane protein